jgi:hypothetical protein
MTLHLKSLEKLPIDYNIPVNYPLRNYIQEFTKKNTTLLPDQLDLCLLYINMLFDNNIPVIFNLDHFLFLLEQISDGNKKIKFYGKDFNSRKREIHWMAIADQKIDNPKCWKNFNIPKKTGGERQICAPEQRLKMIQKWILENILYKVKFLSSESAHGFIPGKSIVTNAEQHLQKKIIFNIDLKDFFPSITSDRVLGLFNKFGYTDYLCEIFTGLCTNKGLLAQGASTSPMITNLICRNLDRRLYGFARKYEFSYTRYADDITFSGGFNLLKHKKYILSIIEDEDFAIARKKLRVIGQGNSQTVTGIITNKRLNVNRSLRKNIRATIYNCNKNGILSDERNRDIKFKNSIYGKVSFINMINPELAKKYWTELDSLNWDEYDEWKSAQSSRESESIPGIEKVITEMQNDIKKILKTTEEINIKTEEINQMVVQIFFYISKQPDLIAEKLKDILTGNTLQNKQKSKIQTILDKYLLISDVAEKSEFWITHIKTLIQIAPIILNFFKNFQV